MAKSQAPGQLPGRGGLSRASLEVHDRDDLKLLFTFTVGDILLCVGSTVLVEIVTKFGHLLGGVEASAAASHKWDRPLVFQMEPLQVVRSDAEIMCHLGHCEPTQGLLPSCWEFLYAQLVQLARNLRALGQDFVVKLE